MILDTNLYNKINSTTSHTGKYALSHRDVDMTVYCFAINRVSRPRDVIHMYMYTSQSMFTDFTDFSFSKFPKFATCMGLQF